VKVRGDQWDAAGQAQKECYNNDSRSSALIQPEKLQRLTKGKMKEEEKDRGGKKKKTFDDKTS